MHNFPAGNSRRRIVSVLSACAALLLFTAASDAGAAIEGGVGSHARSNRSNLSSALDCFDCVPGDLVGCAATEHYDNAYLFTPHFKGTPHDGCHTSSDPDHLCQDHEACNAFTEELQANAEALLKRDDQRGLNALVAAIGTKLSVDFAKKQLSVIGCDGIEVAHLRLSIAQVRALDTSNARN